VNSKDYMTEDEKSVADIAGALAGKNHVLAAAVVCAALNALFLLDKGITAQVVYRSAVEHTDAG
jgi:hypothetical protein